MTVPELAAKYGLSARTIRTRLRLGWSVEDITKPVSAAATRAAEKKRAAEPTRYRVHDVDLTASEIEAKYGVDAQKFLWRVQHGWQTEEALGLKPHQRRQGGSVRRYLMHGEQLTIGEIVARYNVNAQKLWWRLRNGWTPEEAVGDDGPKRYTVHGNEMTAAEVEAKYGVDAQKFRWRVRQGWSPEQALSGARLARRTVVGERLVPKEVQHYVVCGHPMTVQQIESVFGVNPDTFRKRERRWGAERAALEPVRPAERTFTIRGEDLTVARIVKKYGINAGTFKSRIQRGIDPEQAVDVRLISDPARYRVQGKMMTATDVERRYGVDARTFRWRVSRGWSPTQAVALRRLGRRDTPGARHEVHGALLTAAQVEQKYGVDARKFRWRIKRGIPPEQAIRDDRLLPRRAS